MEVILKGVRKRLSRSGLALCDSSGANKRSIKQQKNRGNELDTDIILGAVFTLLEYSFIEKIELLNATICLSTVNMVNGQYVLPVIVHGDLARYYHCFMETHWRLKALGVLNDFLKYHSQGATTELLQGATAGLQRGNLFCNTTGSLLARAK